MDRARGEIDRAKATYFFKETFRSHSNKEYKELFSRGLNRDNSGVTGAHPWLYVRLFFMLFMIFTANIIILRMTENDLFAPSVMFLGAIVFCIPFAVLLYELYPKRDFGLYIYVMILIGGGTAACALSQIVFYFIPYYNGWWFAFVSGVVEETSKAIVAVLAIIFTKKKNPYVCFLIGTAVGAGFSIIEDMGYIYRTVSSFGQTDIAGVLQICLDRGLTSFCTHILWTGAVGWAYSLPHKPYRSVWTGLLFVSIAIHTCWDLPLTGWSKYAVSALCIIAAAAINISIVHRSRIKVLESEVNIIKVNDAIVREAKEMGDRLRFTNASNLTFALSCQLLAIIILVLCALPIGVNFTTLTLESREEFADYIQCGYTLYNGTMRPYDSNGENFVERKEDGEIVYVIQVQKFDGCDGLYYFEYYMSDKSRPYSISVELDEYPDRKFYSEFNLGRDSFWAYNINPDVLSQSFHSDGTVTVVINTEEFTGYNFLIGLCATGCAIVLGCTVILISFRIKLRRLKDEGL